MAILTPADQPVSPGLIPAKIANADPSNPGIAVENPDGTMLPIDGNHRYARARQLNWEYFRYFLLTEEEDHACRLCRVRRPQGGQEPLASDTHNEGRG